MDSVKFSIPNSDKVYTGTIVRRFDGGALVDCAELGRPVSILDDQIISESEESNGEAKQKTT